MSLSRRHAWYRSLKALVTPLRHRSRGSGPRRWFRPGFEPLESRILPSAERDWFVDQIYLDLLERGNEAVRLLPNTDEGQSGSPVQP